MLGDCGRWNNSYSKETLGMRGESGSIDITECRPERGDVSWGWSGRRNSSDVEGDQH